MVLFKENVFYWLWIVYKSNPIDISQPSSTWHHQLTLDHINTTTIRLISSFINRNRYMLVLLSNEIFKFSRNIYLKIYPFDFTQEFFMKFEKTIIIRKLFLKHYFPFLAYQSIKKTNLCAYTFFILKLHFLFKYLYLSENFHITVNTSCLLIKAFWYKRIKLTLWQLTHRRQLQELQFRIKWLYV